MAELYIEIDNVPLRGANGEILRWNERWAAKETAPQHYRPGVRVRIRKG